MITGMWMEIVNCQIRGPDSQYLMYCKRNHQMGIHGLERDWRENKRPQGPTNYGQKCGSTCQMHPNAKRSENGLSKNPKLTSLILRMSSDASSDTL